MRNSFLLSCFRGRPRSSSHRAAFTLLEIVLALAILAGSLLILSELVRIGSHSAATAVRTTQAQLLCQSKLSELVAGLEEPAVVPPTPMLDAPDWLYTVNLQRIDEQGLMAVEVTVSENLPEGRRPVSFSLVRWMPDPGMELPEGAALNPTAEAVGSEAAP